jgi:hypothetical protein
MLRLLILGKYLIKHAELLKPEPRKSHTSLRGQYFEIFDPRFLHQSNPPAPLTNGLKPFRTWLRIRRDIRFESRQILSPWIYSIQYSLNGTD